MLFVTEAENSIVALVKYSNFTQLECVSLPFDLNDIASSPFLEDLLPFVQQVFNFETGRL